MLRRSLLLGLLIAAAQQTACLAFSPWRRLGTRMSTDSSGTAEARARTRDMLLSGRRGGQTAASPDAAGPTTPVGVLFDFDGTLGDTETPAMQVAFWELAPFFATEQSCDDYIRNNAGRPFEAMLEECDESRSQAGLRPVDEVRLDVRDVVPETVLATVDAAREKFGLQPVAAAVGKFGDMLQMQKEETVEALSSTAEATSNCIAMLDALDAMGSDHVRYCIATTSPKPRVPVCVDAAGLRQYFSPESIHSGESDFNPPRFKPDPSVYLKAAEWVGIAPEWCVAVEDSASGVGSASNAGIGLIVGYVGATHIAPAQKESHAAMLMEGTRAESGRGAAVVIEDLADLPKIVEYFRERALQAGEKGLCLGPSDGEQFKGLCSNGRVFVN